MLVLTVGNGTHAFTLDREVGSFMLTTRGMRIPEETKEFAVNMSNQRFWEAPMQRYVGDLLAGKEGPRGKDFNMRWVASMVADVHRILTRGGIFSYPLDSKCATKGGKLRLMYEANPMSLLVEQAGGAASTGRQRMLEVQPNGLHQRVPVFLGSKNEVEAAVRYHLEHDAAGLIAQCVASDACVRITKMNHVGAIDVVACIRATRVQRHDSDRSSSYLP